MNGRPSNLSRSEVEHAFASGWSIPLSMLVVKGVWRTDGGTARVAVVAGRKLGGAVQRNRARRRLGEAIRRAARRLPGGMDLVAIVRQPLLLADTHDLELEVGRMLDKVMRAKAKTT